MNLEKTMKGNGLVVSPSSAIISNSKIESTNLYKRVTENPLSQYGDFPHHSCQQNDVVASPETIKLYFSSKYDSLGRKFENRGPEGAAATSRHYYIIRSRTGIGSSAVADVCY